MATYDKDYAIRMLKDAIDFAQAEGDFAPARKWSIIVEGLINELKKEADDLEEGMKLIMSITPSPTPEQVKANADAVCDEYERTYLNRQISMEVNHNPCPECSARHGCKYFCQVRKAYERNRPYHSDTNNSFVTRIMSAEHVDVSKYFGGVKATASKSWVERHLNDGGE